MTDEGLPRFNPEAKCPKCGCDNITARYRIVWYARSKSRGDQIHRSCVLCGYEWDEHCQGSREVPRYFSEGTELPKVKTETRWLETVCAYCGCSRRSRLP